MYERGHPRADRRAADALARLGRLIDRVFTRGRMAWAAIIAAGGAVAALLNTKLPGWWPGQ